MYEGDSATQTGGVAARGTDNPFYIRFSDAFLEKFVLKFKEAYDEGRFPQYNPQMARDKIRTYAQLLREIPQIEDYVKSLPKDNRLPTLVEEDIMLASFAQLDNVLKERIQLDSLERIALA